MTTFAVSKVRLDDGGRITDVLWGQVDTVQNNWATSEVVAPVAEAVDALHAGDRVFALFPSTHHGHVPEREFVVADYDDERKAIVLNGPATHEREVLPWGCRPTTSSCSRRRWAGDSRRRSGAFAMAPP